MQNTPNAVAASARSAGLVSSLANTIGARTKKFFTHWFGRAVRIIPRIRHNVLPSRNSGMTGMGLLPKLAGDEDVGEPTESGWPRSSADSAGRGAGAGRETGEDGSAGPTVVMVSSRPAGS